MPDLEALTIDTHNHPALAGVPRKFGRLALKENADYPLITWVPGDGRIDASDDVGTRLSSGTTRARQIRTHMQPFEVHCWGATLTASTDLMHAVVFAAYQQHTTGGVDFGDFSIFTEAAGTADYANRGSKVVLSLTFRIPVTEDSFTLTALTAQSHAGDFVSDLTGTPETIC